MSLTLRVLGGWAQYAALLISSSAVCRGRVRWAGAESRDRFSRHVLRVSRMLTNETSNNSIPANTSNEQGQQIRQYS